MPREKFRTELIRAIGRVESPRPVEMEVALKSIPELNKYPDVVTKGVDGVLVTCPDTSVGERMDTSFGLALNMKLIASEFLTPSWMSKGGLVKMTKELSSSVLWEDLLSNLPRDDKTRQHLQDLGIDYQYAGELVAQSNARFVTSALTLGLFAAAVGPSAKDTARGYIIKKDFINEIADRYTGPAQDVETFMDRVQELVPNPETSDIKGDKTLLQTMIRHKTFESKDKRCPAVYITQLTLGEWGKHLDTDPEYRRRFISTVKRVPLAAKYMF